jgi:hypothetical protein
VAAAEKLVENHADREQVGDDLPAGEVGVGRLIWEGLRPSCLALSLGVAEWIFALPDGLVGYFTVIICPDP